MSLSLSLSLYIYRESEVGRGSCELGILWSDLVRELHNNKCMGNPDLLSG